jgi:hypothetical protein
METNRHWTPFDVWLRTGKGYVGPVMLGILVVLELVAIVLAGMRAI